MINRDRQLMFLESLDDFITNTEYRKPFKGKTQAVRELKRLRTRAYLKAAPPKTRNNRINAGPEVKA